MSDRIEELRREYAFTLMSPDVPLVSGEYRFEEEPVRYLLEVLDGDEERAEGVLAFMLENFGSFHDVRSPVGEQISQLNGALMDVVDYIRQTHAGVEELRAEFVVTNQDRGMRDPALVAEYEKIALRAEAEYRRRAGMGRIL
ncbi:MAG: hypothetical protein KJ718_01860 [Nanoarchaeota archaeon]|nr:hypothetical protein [Nanoarchaeota archaeon]MBU1051280.1 hypothetical protein [Nanoarchaeota archaeon]